MQAFAEGAAEQGLQLFAEVPGVWGREVGLEGLTGLPDLIDGEMVRVAVLLENLEADDAGVFAAIGFKFVEKSDGFGQDLAAAGNVDVSYAVQRLFVGSGNGARGREQGDDPKKSPHEILIRSILQGTGEAGGCS